MSNKQIRILPKNELLKNETNKRKKINMIKFSKIIQSIISKNEKFNASNNKIIEKNLNYSIQKLNNINETIKTFDKLNSKNIEKLINQIKKQKFDLTCSSNLTKSIR